MCEPEGGRFNVTNQTFTEGDAGRPAMFRTFFPHAPSFTRKEAAGMVRYARYPGSTERSSTCPWQRHVISAATLMVLNLGERSTPSDHVAIRVVTRKPLDHRGTGKRIPAPF